MELKNISVVIERISGQSMYEEIIFEGKFYSWNGDVLASAISKILGTQIEESWSQVFVVVGSGISERIKLDIISKIVRDHKDAQIVDRENECGGDFGFNIFVGKEISLSVEQLQQQRNKLNRQISTLKKVELKEEKNIVETPYTISCDLCGIKMNLKKGDVGRDVCERCEKASLNN